MESLPTQVRLLATAHGATPDVLALCHALQHDTETLQLALLELQQTHPTYVDAAAVRTPHGAAREHGDSPAEWKSWLLLSPTPSRPLLRPDDVAPRNTPLSPKPVYHNHPQHPRDASPEPEVLSVVEEDDETSPLMRNRQYRLHTSADADGLFELSTRAAVAAMPLAGPPRLLRLPGERYNALQREAIPLIMRGKSVVAFTGQHSGRATTVQLVVEQLTDFSLPNAQFVVVCDAASFYKVQEALKYFIELSRCIVVEGGAYCAAPSRVLPAHEVAIAPRIVFVVGNVEELVAFAVCDIALRARPSQLVMLLDERSSAAARDLVDGAFRSAGIDRNAVVEVAPRHVLRDTVIAAGGIGNYLVRLTEERKFAGLQRLMHQLFDRTTFVVVAATRRKIDRLAESLQPHIPSVAAHCKSPESISLANATLRRVAEEAAAPGTAGLHFAALKPRLCIVCDSNAVASIGDLRSVDVLCYYDFPAPSNCLHHHREVLLGGDDNETLFVAFVATKEERMTALQQRFEWLEVDL